MSSTQRLRSTDGVSSTDDVRARIGRRLSLWCALAVAAALVGCGSGVGSARIWPPGGSRIFSPYVDVTLTAPFDLEGVAAQTGARSLTLAFVTAAGRSCAPAWGGRIPVDAPQVANAATRLRAAGVALRVSFGGAAGEQLALRCLGAGRSAISDLQAAYASVLDRFHAAAADFDLEGRTLDNPRAIANAAQAIARLQRNAPRRLAVSLTLPASQRGLTGPALGAVRAMIAAGVHIGTVDVLAMDYRRSEARGSMATAAMGALRAAHRQLAALSHAPSPWGSLGVVVMVGANDASGEVFTLADTRAVNDFADRVGLGLTSIWSLARDQPCEGGPTAAQATCSGVSDPPYAFSRAFGAHSNPNALPRRVVDSS